MTLVITTCTNRKRKPVSESLHVSSLPQAEMDRVATEWSARLTAEEERFPAYAIYGGRAFQESAAAADTLNARLLIVSAGLGLIDGSDRVPPYACTVLDGAPDSIAGRIGRSFSLPAWWEAVSRSSPFTVSLAESVAAASGLICAALSETYIEMIAADLVGLSAKDRDRLRLFTRAPVSRIAPELRPSVMPYDDRFDGPDSSNRGTRSDFAGRAMHHFADIIVVPGDERSADEHAEAVCQAQSGWRAPPRFERSRYDDQTLLALMRENWDAAGGSSSRLLRLFRDELNIACEQSRFASLARQVREART